MATHHDVNDVTKRIRRIAMIVILISSLVALLSGLNIPYLLSVYIAFLFLSFALMDIVPELKALGSIMTVVVGLTIFIIHLIKLLKGEYSTLFKVFLGLIGWGLMPLVAGVFLLTSRIRSRNHYH